MKEKKKKEAVFYSKKQPSPLFFSSRLKIEGFNQTKILSLLAKNGVEILCIEKEKSSLLYITVSNKYIKKITELLKNESVTTEVVKEQTKKSFGKFLLRNLALILAFVFFIGLGAFSYGFVIRLEVSGTERLESAYIQNFLAENGVRTGMRKNRINRGEIRALLNTLDDILDSSVEIVGTTLRIGITETTIHTPPTEGSDRGIFSNFNATITRVNALDGTANVNIGDRVFRGARLISPFVLDTYGNEIPSVAKGSVWGEVSFVDTIDFSLTETITIKTGRKKANTRLSIWGLNMGLRPRNSFTLYQKEAYSFYPFNNFWFPFRANRTVFHELKEVETEHDIEERTNFFLQDALLRHSITTQNAPLTQTHILENISENAYRLHIFSTAEMLIS